MKVRECSLRKRRRNERSLMSSRTESMWWKATEARTRSAGVGSRTNISSRRSASRPSAMEEHRAAISLRSDDGGGLAVGTWDCQMLQEAICGILEFHYHVI
jgi:hypothetical protein